MEKQEYSQMNQLEKNNWWYIGMRAITKAYVKPFLPKHKLQILDAGCGTGANMKLLQRYGTVQGIDISDEALSFCRKKNLSVSKASIENIPFPAASFDLITSFDVIYHKSIKDDTVVLRQMNRVLRERGLLLIRVAAFDFLYGDRDRLVHTARRYTKKQLIKKLKQAGFKIEAISYVNFFLFPLAVLARTWERLRHTEIPQSDLAKTPGWLNSFLKNILYLEAFLLKYTTLPFGVSIVCVARKRN